MKQRPENNICEFSSEEGCSPGVMIKVELHKFSKTKAVTKFTFVNFYICSRAMLFLLPLDVIGCL